MNVLLAILGAGALLLLIWWGLQAFAHYLVYPRSRWFPPEWETDLLPREDISFTTRDGIELHGVWFTSRNAKGALLVCHGNRGNLSSRLWIPRDLQDLPLDIFIFDYRGYGRSRGRPSEKGTALDVEAAWQVCAERVGGGEDPPLVMYGRSLGGAVALQAADHLPCRGLILESTFTSILDVGLRDYPWLLPRVTCRTPYMSRERILKVDAPILVAHSPEDQVVPYDMGQMLFDLAPRPYAFCELTGIHDEAGWQTSPEYGNRLRTFIDDVL